MRFAGVMGPLSSVFDLLTFAGLLLMFHAAPHEFRTVWFVESMATQILVIFIIRPNGRPWSNWPHPALTVSSLAALAVAMILPFTPVGSWFGCHAPPIEVTASVGLARRARELTRNSARGFAPLQEAGFIDDQDRFLVGQRFQRVISHDVAQRIGVPLAAPRIACCRHGPGSPAASAHIQPVLRGSLPNSPSRNCPADAATRFWPNKGPTRPFTSRSDDAQKSSVASIDAPAIHDLPNHGGSWIRKSVQNATVMLGQPLRLASEGAATAGL
jgi:hypothetical protein